MPLMTRPARNILKDNESAGAGGGTFVRSDDPREGAGSEANEAELRLAFPLPLSASALFADHRQKDFR